MQLVSRFQSAADQLSDKVFAAMETGNTGQARMILNEIKDVDAAVGARVSTEVLTTYGVKL